MGENIALVSARAPVGVGWQARVYNLLFPSEYQSVKFVRVANPKLAGFHRLVFLLTLAYVIGYQIIYDKGYQKVDPFAGTPLVKVKGVAKTRRSGKVYDAVDLVKPALEENSVFIQTNFFETPKQKREKCPGLDEKGGIPAYVSEVCDCGDDPVNCSAGHCLENVPTENGMTTGKCVRVKRAKTESKTKFMCEIEAWCPLEDENFENTGRLRDANILDLVANFTVFVRVDGRFPNLAPNTPMSNFGNRELIWNANLFYVSDIVAAAHTGKALVPLKVGNRTSKTQQYPPRLSQQYFLQAAEKGAEIFVDVAWNCNLDISKESCEAQYSFQRVDNGKGFNYRDSIEYTIGNVAMRDTIKRYGIRLVFRVHGIGGKFDMLASTIVLGSGIGLLGISTVLADLLLYWGKRNRIFVTAKYQKVVEADNESGEDSQDDEEISRQYERLN
uniref:ATP receptor n=1 Tax=Aplanochytrium stocchinoi TaxID=215587 RepID=A0A7S3PAF7_9STRA|mmetsp:Transcript_12628/g.16396  ORF Transcript_12628/g.16396 Transcript_12628/m.16396 type:complete len:444 (+) Transcript_12628:51-1382(+)